MRYKILSVFAALAAITACGDLTSINHNPNGPVDVPPPSILPSVIQTLAPTVNGVSSLNIRGGGLWVQYYSEIQYRDEDKFILRSGTTGGWCLYNSVVEDVQRIIVKGQASNAANWTAVGRTLKAYAFSVMTDAMGDLPYTQALRGDTVLHPAYDSQKSIYDSLLANVALASSSFNLAPGATGFANGDLLYGGDMAKWQKFANSLRLRLAIHLSKADAAKYISRIGALGRYAPDAPLVFLACIDVPFLQAKAAERGWIPGGSAAAATFYTNAITASMRQYGIADTATTRYLAQGKVQYDSAGGATLTGHLQQIAYQKWLSMFMQGPEAWTEWRRTLVPTIVAGCHAALNQLPERLPYDDQEAVLNKANVDAAVTAQGFIASNDISKALWVTGRTASPTAPAPAYCPPGSR